MLKLKEIVELLRRNNLLNQAYQDSLVMLENTYTMFQESRRSLRESDAGELHLDVYEKDRMVNKYEQEVRRKVLKHLAITGGVDIIPGLILTTIVIDIERIGDYTKNIMDLAVVHPRRLRCGRFDEDVKRIEAAVAHLFQEIVPVLQESDKEKARELIQANLWVAKRCDEIVNAYIGEPDPDLDAGTAVAAALYTRYLKRIGAHLMNILTSVVNPFERIGFHETGEA